MSMPMSFTEGMRDLHFSMKLCRIMKRLYDESYDVNITKFNASPISDPLDRSLALDIHVHKDSMGVYFDEHFRCLIPREYALHPSECTEKYNKVADLIYDKIFKTTDDTKPRIFTVSKEEALFIKNLKEELASRGDFVIDVPKFVDVLFKLGVMIPKEDVEKIPEPESDEEDDIKEPW